MYFNGRITQTVKDNYRSLLIGLILSLLFAGLFFNPFTRANITFAVRIDPDMRNLRGVDTSVMALLYFAISGAGLGMARLAISQHFTGLRAMVITWTTMLIGSVTSIYVGLRLLNPALTCMLEICHSTFLLNYGLPTLGLGIMLASHYVPEDLPPQNSSSGPGCSETARWTIFLVGLALLIAGIVIYRAIGPGLSGGGC